jgi:hypothetical protein
MVRGFRRGREAPWPGVDVCGLYGAEPRQQRIVQEQHMFEMPSALEIT